MSLKINNEMDSISSSIRKSPGTFWLTPKSKGSYTLFLHIKIIKTAKSLWYDQKCYICIKSEICFIKRHIALTPIPLHEY